MMRLSGRTGRKRGMWEDKKLTAKKTKRTGEVKKIYRIERECNDWNIKDGGRGKEREKLFIIFLTNLMVSGESGTCMTSRSTEAKKIK